MRNVADIIVFLLAKYRSIKLLDKTQNSFSGERETLGLHNDAEGRHFSRWKYLRRRQFASREQVAGYVSALRTEWGHR